MKGCKEVVREQDGLGKTACRGPDPGGYVTEPQRESTPRWLSYAKRHVRSEPRSGTRISLRPGTATTWCGCELSWRAALVPEPLSCSTARRGSSRRDRSESDRRTAMTVPQT